MTNHQSDKTVPEGWRRVCARRAAKLRKRGLAVKFFCWTTTGKALYIWASSY